MKNNKGYVLVEIVMAFAITFTLIYFIMNLVIKLKNKNDDFLVETLTKIDQAIISNEIMEKTSSGFVCGGSGLVVDLSSNSVKYYGTTIYVNKYAKLGTASCSSSSITIPLSVKQLSDKKFDIVLKY